MSQLKEWMYGGKITKLVVVITSKETGEHVERWQFDVSIVAISKERQLTAQDSNIREKHKSEILKESCRSGKLNCRVSWS